jgi:hypothetical protein
MSHPHDCQYLLCHSAGDCILAPNRLHPPGGDPHLGGDDWDAAVVEWLEREHLHPAGIDTTGAEITANLKALAEYAKVQLSEHESVVLR